MSVFLFPVPRKHSLENHKIDFHTTRWIHIDPSMSSVIKHHAHKLSDTLSTYFEQPLSLVAGEPKKNSTFLSIALENSDAPPQGYMITINDDGITLRGSDEPGIFYGLQTLQQLIMQTGTYVPAGVIEDYPDFPSRGFMLDISRCKVPSMDSLRKLIDMLAAFKINQLQLYMEHTFAFSAHREVWHDASPMTAEEIVELDSLCKQRFIELVP